MQDQTSEVRDPLPAILSGLSPWQPVLKCRPMGGTFLHSINQQYSDVFHVFNLGRVLLFYLSTSLEKEINLKRKRSVSGNHLRCSTINRSPHLKVHCHQISKLRDMQVLVSAVKSGRGLNNQVVFLL